MRRVALLALLALALPTAALANSIDFTLVGGTLNTSTGVISANVTGVSLCNPSCPPPTSLSGTTTITIAGFNPAASGNLAGSTISLSAGGYIFNGSFTSGSYTLVPGGQFGNGYIFAGVATGTLTVNGVSVQTSLNFASGQTTLSTCPQGVCPFASGDVTLNTVPEPGTLGLLGTGLVGLAGMIRRKMRG